MSLMVSGTSSKRTSNKICLKMVVNAIMLEGLGNLSLSFTERFLRHLILNRKSSVKTEINETTIKDSEAVKSVLHLGAAAVKGAPETVKYGLD